MKKSGWIVFCAVLICAGVQAEVLLSNPASVPADNVALSQLQSGGTIVQARNLASDLSNWRAITQTFFWNSLEDFEGIGLYMDTGNESYWTGSSIQAYTFIIQELDDSTLPIETVFEVEFELTGDKVADGQWLYIDTDSVALEFGKRYGFTLAPAETAVSGALRTFWGTATGDAYAVGLARQYAPASSGALPKSDTYTQGGSVNDYAFYMIHAQPTVLSNPEEVPAYNIAVSQLDSSGSVNVQARQRGPGDIGDWRVITESFQWTGSGDFDGIGLLMGDGNDALWSSSSTQVYQFVVQALDSLSNLPTQTLINVEFYLTGDMVADGQWLYIDTPDVSLEEDAWYGFSMGPAEGATDAGLRTYWDTASGDAYAGVARQYAPTVSGAIPKTDSYAAGGGVPDYTFYITEAVTGNAAAVIAGLSSVSGDVLEMTVYVPGALNSYHPEYSETLLSGSWSNVSHSIDGNEPFVVTNFEYSTEVSNGVERVIYVKAAGEQGFFNVTSE